MTEALVDHRHQAPVLRRVGIEAAHAAQLGDALRGARPDLQWGGRQPMRGEQGMGVGEGTGALEELADLQDLEAALGQDYPGASLDDVDEAAVQRALATALQKISSGMNAIPTKDLRASSAMNAFFIAPAIKGVSLSQLTSTHPSLEQRLEQLAKIEAELSRPLDGTDGPPAL